MALRELQTYYQKSVMEDGEDAAKATWHRDMWHRIIQRPLSGELGGDREEEEETSGTEDSNSSSRSSSGSWSDNDIDDRPSTQAEGAKQPASDAKTTSPAPGSASRHLASPKGAGCSLPAPPASNPRAGRPGRAAQ
ncbi:hypothetical protein Y1Q_0000880 [Alligator mississippiensis]|uniref:Uncharacterized protein n=1 Tax=Alligator mississippiensis TaxID=8496 RepID=A0A151NJN3_ALLMI|nr:hypothetical protein Y1Q_0000880 [Alligator mississippiensis]